MDMLEKQDSFGDHILYKAAFPRLQTITGTIFGGLSLLKLVQHTTKKHYRTLNSHPVIVQRREKVKVDWTEIGLIISEN